MEKSKVKTIDTNLRVIEDINQFEQIGGVWAAFDSDGECWNVAETKNIANEMREDIIYTHFSYVADPSWEMAKNHFGDDMFICPSTDLIAMCTWAKVAKQCEGKEIYFVIFELLSNVDDKEENLKIISRRKDIEKYIAYKTRAVYWRNGRRFEHPERMEKAVKEFIESFEKDENNIEIKNRLNRLMEEILIKNIDKIHTTDMGVDRIRRNLGLGDVDVVSWCKERVLDKTSIKERQGKNWYVRADGCVITINASSYTIITCHKE